ncbi:MAG: bifunctional diaminohydroxyphosphoribosylaminopyrimidine deaminase/5-amino-6-(5-phosphoribosylamino)uracil reductase RibD [Chlamydiota bacterium]
MKRPEAPEQFMRLALALARRGKGFTSPNPAVGAVIVKGGKVVGTGWHRRPGAPHAEVVALMRAGRGARGGTLYVTLEPCCTWGRTPPCTDAILRAGIATVVVAARDPNPRHNGRGLRLLRRRGLVVREGLLGTEAAALNEDFAKHVTTGLPFTIVKSAMSIDGKIAAVGGRARWISGPASRARAHALRMYADAVLVGKTTAVRDDPDLTARPTGGRGRIPWRVILDSGAAIPLDARVLKPAAAGRTIVAVTGRAPRERIARIGALGARVLRCPARRGRVSIRALWRLLGRMGIMSVLVEGGGETIASVLEAGVADRYVAFVAPKIIGGREAPTPVGGTGVRSIADALRLGRMEVTRLGEDLLIEAPILRH